MEPLELPAWANGLFLAAAGLSIVSWAYTVRQWWRLKPAVPAEPRRAVPWGASGAMLAVLSVGLVWLSQLAIAEKPATGDIRLVDALGEALVCFAFATLAMYWQRNQHCAEARDFGAPESLEQFIGDARLGISAAAAMLLPVYLVQSALVFVFGLPSSHPSVESLINNPNLELVLATTLMAVIVAPFYEEIAFRVLLQGWLERLGGPTAWWPVVVASAVFASAHAGQGFAPIPIFVLSLGMGHLYRQTHRAAPCVIMHMAFNAFSLAMAIAAGSTAAGAS